MNQTVFTIGHSGHPHAPADAAATSGAVGFTKKSAEVFFTRLKHAGVKRVVDVRLNNVSQLAGFTRRDDLRL